ncbi:hypothetical protein C8J95_11272 [Elizabethkingia sp. YR214]|uniref:hypothetical protein n=1 Tax=Elizabethkingia sp. YR214 TaxID=2135667 RepID=UPI000D31E48C|nr:hypothetical protein [Elizabethkingia sp. YR214]PUB25905.1 hypothetical protein C8J95_11272 [Elizabethkingia sp. YR214]
MSMHEIEDLVEETVYLVDRSSKYDLGTKRSILYNLYNIQAMFDTGYTHFRVMDILLKNHFVYKIPIAQYFQLGITEAQLPDDGGWIYDEAQNTIAYAEREKGIMYLYCDAGEEGWKRLCKQNVLQRADQLPPQKMCAVQTAVAVLTEAETQQEMGLLKQWYSFFVNSLLQGDFGNEESISNTFEGLLANQSFIEIRAIAQRYRLDKQKKRKNSDDYLSFPGLKASLFRTTEIEKTYIVRYLLELSKSAEKLHTIYKKDKQTIEKGPEKINLIYPVVNAHFAPLHWKYLEIEKAKSWLWYKDISDEQYGGPGHRQFIMLELDVKEKTLFCKQALQHSLILKWQQKFPDLLPENWHFYYDTSGWLPDEFTQKNIHLGSWGSWKFDIKQSKKLIKSHLENLIAGLEITGYFDFLLDQFPKKFSGQDPQKIIYLLENGEGEKGIVPKHVLFDSKITTLIAFAKIYMEQGDPEKAANMIGQIEKIAATERISPLQKNTIIEPVLHHWLKNKEIIFPPVWQNFLLQALRKTTKNNK